MQHAPFRTARLVGRIPDIASAALYTSVFGADAPHRLERNMLDWDRHNVAPWTLAHAGQDVGVGGFNIGFGGNGLELSFYFLPRVQGQGLASEFARAALDYGTDILKADRFYAVLSGDADASRRILARVGFRDDVSQDDGAVMILERVRTPRETLGEV